MLRMVSPQEWDLSKLPDAARRERLLNPPSAECLLTYLIDEATHAAERGDISLNWEPAKDKKVPSNHYFRLSTQISVNECIFDLLFNSRSGYRAQYYLSPEEGILYNRQIIDTLIPAIRTAYDRKPCRIKFQLIERSLCTPHAKIWVFENRDEKNPFVEAAENTLNPTRWVKHCASLGRRCPLPDCLKIDLKGSFIDPQTGCFFVDELKVGRPCDLHCKGYT